jgi:hypothetical protein
MSVPNLFHLVESIRASWTRPFHTQEDLCAYSNTVVVALHQADPDFGHLQKSAGASHCTDPQGRFCAKDVAFYRPTGQVVDFIQSAGYGFPPDVPYEDQNKAVWGEGPENEYGPGDWFAPVASGDTPPPDPPPSTDLEARVTALEQQVRLIEAQLLAQVNGLQSQITELAKQIADMHQLFVPKPLPLYEGTGRVGVFGGSFTVTSRPK